MLFDDMPEVKSEARKVAHRSPELPFSVPWRRPGFRRASRSHPLTAHRSGATVRSDMVATTEQRSDSSHLGREVTADKVVTECLRDGYRARSTCAVRSASPLVN